MSGKDLSTRPRKSCFLVLFFLAVFFGSAIPGWSQQEGVGLGVILGEPTGVSFKTWLKKTHAIDAAAAWSFGREDALHLHADYLIHNYSLLTFDKTTIPLYYGIGGRLKFENNSRFGVRFPVGITVFIREAPIDLFLEVVPILNLAPDTDFDMNAAIGARYYF
jgi:hypothetical protein